LERINPYAVTRNTATYEAYRAYMREAVKAGQPFLLVVFLVALLPVILMPLSVTFEKRLAHGQPADVRLLLAVLLAPPILIGALAVLGFLRMRRFRREHPIPDEWRQIPRVTPWPAPAQRPRRH
jgi:hypothetical protein